MSNVPAAVNFSSPGIVGQVQFQAKSVQCVTLAPATVLQAIPLPVGLSSAAFVAVSAGTMQDLEFQLANTVGATALPVPANTTVLLYNADEIFVSSAQGGTFQLILG